MRYLRKYQMFLEDSFDTKDTDPDDVKIAKEKMNDIKKEMDEYQNKKSQIANIYQKIKTKEDLSEVGDLVKPIIGEDEANQFLVKFNTISRIEKEIELLHDEIVQDKIKEDEMRSEANLVKDSETKALAMDKVKDIQNRISDKNQKILDKTKEFEELEKAHIQEIEDMKIDMKDYINKISNSE